MSSQTLEVPSDAGLADSKLVEPLKLMGLMDEVDGDGFVLVECPVSGMSKSTTSPRKTLQREPERLSTHRLISWQNTLLKDPKNRLALSAFNDTDPRSLLKSPTAALSTPQIFNVKIPFEGSPMTNQRSSGRCWLFAATNIFRVALARRHNLDAFELSQSYLFFWDKLEKANWFLEQVVDTSGEDLEGRLVQALLGDIVSDGGQWDMVYNLVEKYGLVPHALFPDSWSARNSRRLNDILQTKLREAALNLREMMATADVTAEDIADAKEKTMQEVLLILTVCLGRPPSPEEDFTWSFLDKDGTAHELTTNPRAFAKNIYSPYPRVTSASIASMVSLVHDPRHEPLTLLTVSRLGNIVGGRGVTYVNVTMKHLKTTCVAMLRAGLPVFFGCDVGKFSDSASGIMDLGVTDYEAGFNVSLLGMDKASRLRAGESSMTHAMVLTGVHLDKRGQSVRWRVQNSWGENAGEKGWFVMGDGWMDEFVYQAVVDERFLTEEVKDVLGTEPIVLPLWDPMGSLA